MIRTNIFLSDGQRAALAELAKDTNQSIAEIARRAIDFYTSLLDGGLTEVLQEAHKTFPDVEGDDLQAIRRALLHWKHNREENSIRGALRRIDGKLDRLLEDYNVNY